MQEQVQAMRSVFEAARKLVGIREGCRYDDVVKGLQEREATETVAVVEVCPGCGGDAAIDYLDRYVCACGTLHSRRGTRHTRCPDCGDALDGCEFDASDPAEPATTTAPLAPPKESL